MGDLYQKALRVASSLDVSTLKDSLVLYSVSYLPTQENRDNAFAYVAAPKGSGMIEHTPCGAKLLEMGLGSSGTSLSQDEVADVWKEASRRMIAAASGNVTAFVEGADKRSVFLSIELPGILNNPNITTINGMDKNEFASARGWI